MYHLVNEQENQRKDREIWDTLASWVIRNIAPLSIFPIHGGNLAQGGQGVSFLYHQSPRVSLSREDTESSLWERPVRLVLQLQEQGDLLPPTRHLPNQSSKIYLR